MERKSSRGKPTVLDPFLKFMLNDFSKWYKSRLFASIRKSEGSGTFRLKMKGVKLANVEGWLSKSDPFFEIARKVDSAGAQTW